MVLLVSSTDHVSPVTGATLAISASKDGAAFASISPTVTERGNGWYSLALTTAHSDTLGDLALHISASGADPLDMVLLVEGGSTDADVSSRLASGSYSAPPSAASIRSEMDANSTKLAHLDADVSTRLPTSSYSAPPSASSIRTEMDTNSTKLANLDTTVSSRLAAASYSAPPSAAAVRAEIDANSTKLDATVSSRLAAGSYVAPDNADIAAIKAKTDLLPVDPAGVSDIPLASEIRQEIDANSTKLDAPVSSRMASFSYTAPDNSGISAIKAKTDNLPADPASQSSVATLISAISPAVWAEVIEGGLTAQDVSRILLAVAAGKLTISGSTVSFRDQADSKDRVTATVIGSARTVVSVDPA